MADKNKKDSELSYDELVAKLNETTKKYMDLRFQAIMAHVDNPLQKRTLRREIARLKTLIHQHDLENFRAKAAEALAAAN